MTIRSMTGFGAASFTEDASTVRAEVRSVNHRYLQVKTRLPSDLGYLEPEVEAAVRAALERGSVSVTVALQRRTSATRANVDLEVARRYRKLLDDLADELGLARDVSLDTLVGLPGVIASQEDPQQREREGELVVRSVKQAVAAMLDMRATEGGSLQDDLALNLRSIEKVVARLEKRMPKVVQAHHKSLTKRVNEMIDGAPGGKRSLREARGPKVASVDLARELALIADRMDVSEEFARLKSHVAQWKSLLGKGGPVGRQLDFLVQELLREANTIGSKCNDAETAQGVVELKTLIERLREQVQNVE